MPDIRAILALEHKPFELNGAACLLKRPTLADLVDAVSANEQGPVFSKAWALHRHLLDPTGSPVFSTVDEAMRAPAGIAAKAVAAIEALYSEGSD